MKILLADDHGLFREGMHYVLKKLDDQAQVLDAGSYSEAFDIADKNADLNLALLDFNMPGSEGVSSIYEFHIRYPDILLVVVSGIEQPDDIENIMNNGANGFISKMTSGHEMVHALHIVLDGGIYLPPQLLRHTFRQANEEKRASRSDEFSLTGRQLEVLKHITNGLSNKDISVAMGLAEGTVKIHVAAIFQHLRVSKRIEAVLKAQRLKILPDKPADA